MNTFKGIIYLSVAKINFDNASLQALANEAANKNKLLGVTGYLYFVKNKFLQYLEGDTNAVQSVFDRIEKDARHKLINVLQKEDISDRKFPSWNMKYITKDMLTEIKIENLVIERMEYLKKINEITHKQVIASDRGKSVWRMVDTISRLSKSQ